MSEDWLKTSIMAKRAVAKGATEVGAVTVAVK